MNTVNFNKEKHPLIKNYISIARPDHWFKNIFMLPGVALGISLSDTTFTFSLAMNILFALVASCLAASANYTINEWLDASFDRFHPVKKNRPSVSGLVSGRGVYLQWAILGSLSVGLGYKINAEFTAFIIALLTMGVIYNVRPLRTKDRHYLDVLSESVNNPLRFMLGWSAVTVTIFPPSSILIAYWMGGAFLMAIKRYSEFRFINDPNRAGQYRRSFQFYNEQTLLLSAFFYALTAAFFTGIFLIKYRVEYIIVIPLLALLFVWYLLIGMRSNSVTQNPERLYREKGFMTFLAMTLAIIILLTFVDIPSLNILLETHYR
jgi:decaprenyl-phosphate phosphoribosyltransferase